MNLTKTQKEKVKAAAEEIREHAEESNYIEDDISEQADSLVNIYNSDLRRWAGTQQGQHWTEEAIFQLGWDGCGGELLKAYRMGQYEMYYHALCEELSDLLNK